MSRTEGMTRRRFVHASAVATAGVITTAAMGDDSANERTTSATPKIGIRAASMKMVGDLNVIRMAARIPGIQGVELQTTSGKLNLRDPHVVQQYQREAERWGLRIPSLAGIWDRGVKIHSPGAADSIIKSLRAAEALGAKVILAAFFRQDAPDMSREESYGPLVETLQAAAKVAADAGVKIGLENSLSPADNKRLVDLVDHPAVGVYYDLHNMAFYGHARQAIPGIRLLGPRRICMVHVKNGESLIEEAGPIDWSRALHEFRNVGYDGWYVYETKHDSTEDCLADTARNNRFLQQHLLIPEG